MINCVEVLSTILITMWTKITFQTAYPYPHYVDLFISKLFCVAN